jgi:hypothetical protein
MSKSISKFISQTLVFIAFLAMPVFGLSEVSAQDAPPSETTYDFEDDLVTGDLVRPDGEQLIVRRRGRRASLIQIREHFIPEMLKSVEDL